MGYRKIYGLLLVLGEIGALYASLWFTLVLKYPPAELAWAWGLHRLPFSIVFVLWLVIFFIAGLYEQMAWHASRNIIERLIRSMITAGLLAALLFYLVPTFGITPKTNLLIQSVASGVLIILWRLAFSIITSKAAKSRILFIGVSPEVAALAAFLRNHPHLGYDVVGMSDPITADPEIIREEILDRRVALVVASRDIRSNAHFVRVLHNVLPLGVRVSDFPTFYELITGKVPVSLISEVWFLENLVGMRKRVYEFAKRVLDITLSLIVGCIFIFLLPFIVLGIILSTPGEIRECKTRRAREGDGIIFFRQKRVGQNGREFDFIKFRSQRLGAERMGELKAAEEDRRQYPFGRFLRACYLDELPQIWNVLKGEMSFIGPRPERPAFVRQLKETVPFYEMRLLVPPGITGWAQIRMQNDASVEDAPEKLQYDLYYIKNRTLALDFAIALKTILVMLSREGR